MPKFALIIANTDYVDPGLAQLFAPGKDAEDFARVLKSQDICAFDDVNVLLNQPEPVVREAIDEFFMVKKSNDLLVLYFSGHGVRDEQGALYLAVKNTNRSRLRSTAIKSDFIREAMDQSRSRRQVLILDCCNSGAFALGTKAATGTSIGTASAFEGTGYGRVVLTASDSTQFAWEGNKIIGDTNNSLFTHFLVKGLEGDADQDSDGRITVDELYDYAYEQIVNNTSKQTPGKWTYKQQGEIVLRQRTGSTNIKPVPLPVELLNAIENPLSYVREAAVRQLEELLQSKSIGLVFSAREALERIAAKDDSRRVAQTALGALEATHQAEQLAIQNAERETRDKMAAKQKAQEEAQRIAAKKADDDRIALQKAEAERKAKEETERLAAEKTVRDQAEREAQRLAVEKAERETAEKTALSKAEREAQRLAAESTERERKRLAVEKITREKAEQEVREKVARQQVKLRGYLILIFTASIICFVVGIGGYNIIAPLFKAATAAPAAAPTVTETSAVAPASAAKLIGISMPTKTSTRWISDGNSMVKSFEALGYKTDLQFADNDINNQLAQIENMVTKGANVLVIAAIDGSTMSDVLQKAHDAGVLVISYDRLITKTPNVDYYATFDNFGVGVIQGTQLVEGLGLTSGKPGPFNVELFGGSPDDTNAGYFYNGAMSVIQPYIDSKQIVIVSGQMGMDKVGTLRWLAATAQARMDNLLSAYYTDKKVDGVLSPYDGLSIGILSSLKGVGYCTAAQPCPVVTGQYAEVASVKSIIAGEQRYTVFRDTRELAKQTAVMVDAVLNGQEVPINDTKTYNNGVKIVPSYLLIPYSVDVTNYEKYLIESGYYTADQLK